MPPKLIIVDAQESRSASPPYPARISSKNTTIKRKNDTKNVTIVQSRKPESRVALGISLLKNKYIA
jgi:hypothetical protein